jgi:hypothetical protein
MDDNTPKDDGQMPMPNPGGDQGMGGMPGGDAPTGGDNGGMPAPQAPEEGDGGDKPDGAM